MMNAAEPPISRKRLSPFQIALVVITVVLVAEVTEH